MTRQPVMTRRIQLFIMVALTIFTYLYYYKIYKRMVPDSGGCGCFELFEFDGGISGQSRAPGRCFNYLPGRCPLGWSNWAFRGGSVYFLVYFSGRCSGKSMANPWQIHGKSCSLSTASAYFWCTYPLVNVDITTGYGKSPFFRGKLTISMATVLCTGDPTGFFAGLIPRAFHLWTQNCG